MAKRAATALFTIVSVDHTSPVPLFRQLYEGMRAAVLSGQLAAGVRVPSTRALSREVGVSRHTVLTAFEILLDEGYVEGRRGAGTYIARIRPDDATPERPVQEGSGHRRGTPSRRASTLLAAPVPTQPGPSQRDGPVAFRVGVPGLDVFPYTLWARLLARHWRRSGRHLLGYDDSAGYRPLREAIAGYLGASRGVRCTPAQLVVVAGAQQAVALAAQVLLDPGDAAWIPDPGPLGVRAALRAAGARLIPVPVDADGLDVAWGVARQADARLVCVSPAHQFPLGATMSLDRRVALLDWAAGSDGWVIEIDEHSEFRYGSKPFAALQALDTAQRVIYAGTFSHLLFPTLRLGYLVAPSDLVDTFVGARHAADLYSPALEQAVLADYIGGGYLAHHTRQMRGVYAHRQAVLVNAVTRELGGVLDVQRAESGMHLLGWLVDGRDDQMAARHTIAHGVETQPLSSYVMEARRRGALLLGYTGPNEAEINAGVRQLATALTARGCAEQ